jgi:hypothetical protein
MLDKKLTIYKSLDLHLPSIPQRSHLYSLEPIGVGTNTSWLRPESVKIAVVP